MGACLDPSLPWFGIDFLTWRPPPKPVLTCEGCGVRSDFMMTTYALPGLFGNWAYLVPVTACQGCALLPKGEIVARAEISWALVMGKFRPGEFALHCQQLRQELKALP